MSCDGTPRIRFEEQSTHEITSKADATLELVDESCCVEFSACFGSSGDEYVAGGVVWLLRAVIKSPFGEEFPDFFA